MSSILAAGIEERSHVLTNRGLTEARNIRIGDVVFTHRGNWRKVLNVRHTRGALISRVAMQGGGMMRVAEHHKMLGADRDHPTKDSRGWRQVAWLGRESGVYLASPTLVTVPPNPVAADQPFDVDRISATNLRPDIIWAHEALQDEAWEKLQELGDWSHEPGIGLVWSFRARRRVLQTVRHLVVALGWQAYVSDGLIRVMAGQDLDDEENLAWTEVLFTTSPGYTKHGEPYVGDIVDFEVEGDHSFVADGFVHHNQHAVRVEIEEAQNFPEAGWKELFATMKTGSKGSMMRVHGVTTGERNTFYQMCENDVPGLDFKVHRYTAQYRPSWSDEERTSQIALYGGSIDELDYIRNIYGDHGDGSKVSLFVLRRLLAVVRNEQTLWAKSYNKDIYTFYRLTDERVNRAENPADLISIPENHLDETYVGYYAGVDIGYTTDPTELLVFGLTQGDFGQDVLRLLLRIQMNRVSTPDQGRIIKRVFELYGERLESLGMDRTGAGLPVLQHLVDPRNEEGLTESMRNRVIGYHFSEKAIVAFEDRVMGPNEKLEDLAIRTSVTEWGFSQLRKYVDNQEIELPYDPEILSEFQGQAIDTTSSNERKRLIKKRQGTRVSLHTLDASILMAAAKDLKHVRDMLASDKKKDQVNVFDAYY